MAAAEQGAVETLVIDASMLRSEEVAEWGPVAEMIEGSGGRVVQASTDHDAGQQLLGIGGAIALLRWKSE